MLSVQLCHFPLLCLVPKFVKDLCGRLFIWTGCSYITNEARAASFSIVSISEYSRSARLDFNNPWLFLFVAITINPNDDVPIAIIHFYAWCLCWLFTNKNHRFVLSQMVDLVLVENIDTSRTGCQLSWQLSLFGTVEKQTSTPLVGSWTVLTLIFVVNDAAFACNVFVGGYCGSRRNELVNRGWIWPMSTLHNN